MAVNDGTLTGWPFVNHAMELRGTQTTIGPQRQTMVFPRRKYTWFAEFVINPDVFLSGRMQTDLTKFIMNGRLYTTLKTIDHPKPTYKVETLRSYNKYVKVVTKQEFNPASMVFHDDDSSICMALWKEYMTFYTYAGDVGRNVINGNPRVDQNGEFRLGNDLVGANVRGNMGLRPSVGTTLRPASSRHFFDQIIIYDLGSEPDSVNMYFYVNPVITQNTHQNLDYFDRTGLGEVEFSFEYENYYFLLGQSVNNINEMLLARFGISPDHVTAVDGHATMIPQSTPQTDYQQTSSPANLNPLPTGSPDNPDGLGPTESSPLLRQGQNAATQSATENTTTQYGGIEVRPLPSITNPANVASVAANASRIDRINLIKSSFENQVSSLQSSIIQKEVKGGNASGDISLLNYYQDKIAELDQKLVELQ